jgi:hypothetical protein
VLVNIILGIICFLCLLIFFLDLKYREIWWGWFLILWLAILVHKINVMGIHQAFQFATTNLIILGVQLLGVWVYVKLIKKTNLIDKQLGLGDVVFLVVLCFVFTPDMYLFFFLSVSMLTIIAFIFISMFFEKKSIPLAGILSCFLCLTYIYFLCFQENSYNLYTLNVSNIIHDY